MFQILIDMFWTDQRTYTETDQTLYQHVRRLHFFSESIINNWNLLDHVV